MTDQNVHTRIADFFFEIGTMRKLLRMHRQTLLSDDNSDTIAAHTYRVAMIGWVLAKLEDVDPYKVVMMCLLHDTGEIRSGDHNWVHKRYVKIFDDEIIDEQLGQLPFPELKEFATEYEKRESKESIVVKDADILDQVLLLREYEWQGNKEATIWLHGKGGRTENEQISKLKTVSGKELCTAIYTQNPSDWWNSLYTNTNRK